MPKSTFRILAFRCLQPTNPVGEELHYVSRMQRSLAKESRWYTFFIIRRQYLKMDERS